MNLVSAPVAPPSKTRASRLSAANYSSHLPRLWPPSASSCPLDHIHQVHFQTHSIRDCRCKTNLVSFRSPRSHDRGLHLHISKHTWSRSPITSAIALHHDHGVNVSFHSILLSLKISNLVWLRPPMMKTNGLLGYLKTGLTKASAGISKFTWLQPSCVCANTLNRNIQVNLNGDMIPDLKCIPRFDWLRFCWPLAQECR